MPRLTGFMLLVVLGFTSAPLFAQPPAWRLDLSILKNGAQVAAPEIVVREGEEGELTWQDPKSKGPDMKLTVTVTSGSAPRQAAPVADIAMQLFEFVGGQPTLRTAPSLVVKPGVEASVRLDPETPAQGKAAWEIRVTANRFASVADAVATTAGSGTH